jgi:hypothetical protein
MTEKNDKGTDSNLQNNTQKSEDRATWTPKKPGVNSGARES